MELNEETFVELGKEFIRDGIFGVMKSVLGGGQQAQPRPAAEDPSVKRLVIDNNGADGFEIDSEWLEYFRMAQPYTMDRERPTLRDLESDLIALEIAPPGLLGELKEIVDYIVRDLGAESPFLVILDMRMTADIEVDEPSFSISLTEEESRMLRLATAYVMGGEVVGRPLVVDAFELDPMPLHERKLAMTAFALSLPRGAGRLTVNGWGFFGLSMVFGALVEHMECRVNGPLKEYDEGDPREYGIAQPLSALDLFITRDRFDVDVFSALYSKLGDSLVEYTEGVGSSACDNWRRNHCTGVYYLYEDALPVIVRPWWKYIAKVADKVMANECPTLMDLDEAIYYDCGLTEGKAKEWLQVSRCIQAYHMETDLTELPIYIVPRKEKEE